MARRAQSRVREDPLVRRAQIVDEAIRMIGTRGYNGFTVQALAEKCGLSNAGLLYYFGSKDKLLIALLEEFERQERGAMSSLTEAVQEGSDRPSDEAIIEILRTLVVRFVEQPEMGRFAQVLKSEALDSSHPAYDWFRIREELTLQMFTDLSAYCVDDSAATGRQLLALMNGLEQDWIRTGRGFDLVGEWEKAIRIVLTLQDKRRARGPSVTVKKGKR
jgi:AcrR family transcriptional regulator